MLIHCLHLGRRSSDFVVYNYGQKSCWKDCCSLHDNEAKYICSPLKTLKTVIYMLYTGFE
jgi:hypothetical protein